MQLRLSTYYATLQFFPAPSPNPAPDAAFHPPALTHNRPNRSRMSAISQEAVMRSVTLLLAVVFTVGCGSAMHDPKVTFGTNFNPPALTTLVPNTVPVNSSPFVMIVN